jgi:hypothetical protein
MLCAVVQGDYVDGGGGTIAVNPGVTMTLSDYCTFNGNNAVRDINRMF